MSVAARPTSAVDSPALREPNLDPLVAVLSLDRGITRWGMLLGILGGLFLHGAAAAKGLRTPFWMDEFTSGVTYAVDNAVVDEIDIQMDKEPPKPPEPEPEPEPEQEVVQDNVDPIKETAAQPASAGKTLTAEADPTEPVDMTDFTMTQGEGDRYAGGTTASYGTSDTAVRNPVTSKDGVKGGEGTKSKPPPALPPPPKESKARAAGARGTNWSSCGFPAQADMEQIDFARVRLSVTVDPSGKATAVQVISDPGNGFGSLARSCAFRMRYTPALDPSGNAITASTPPFTVTFTR
ncbi:MAG: hypothetical protein AB7K71_22765 [Polyangiaceae bacterium]